MRISYDDLVDYNKIYEVYRIVKSSTKHKEKICKYEIFLGSNIVNIILLLRSKKFVHSKYNIFLINYPKCRIIMSENMTDKLINHLVSKYVLFPLIEPKLIPTNVATRVDKGSKAGIKYMKKYINKLKQNNDKVYALKCDIHKYFYSIDHKILLQKLKDIIEDKDIYNLLKTIIDSTDQEYINEKIDEEVSKQIKNIKNKNLTNKEKEIKYKELSKIPKYIKGKGLPIGNMTSQIMAIFYMNDLDHFIKEKLHIKYYIRYMDDLVLLHSDKEYLKYCLKEIEKKVAMLNLSLNNKTQIYELHRGIPFLGYKFVLKGKKLYMLLNPGTKKRILKRLKKENKNSQILINNYNGYLKHADCKAFEYKLTKL